MNPVVLIGSLVAILILALVARLLGLGGGELDETGAKAEAEAQLPGFEAARAALEDKDWIVEGQDRHVRLRKLGARWVAEPPPPAGGRGR